MPNFPERTAAYRIYNDSDDLLGAGDVTLPKIAYMTDEVKGAGIAGVKDCAIMGQFQAMAVAIAWHTVNKKQIGLAAFKGHNLELRAGQQVWNSGTSSYDTQSVKIVLRCGPKGADLGSLSTGASTGGNTELEVFYMKVFIDGAAVMELDKDNYIFIVNGVDYLAALRQALGLAG